MSKNNQHLPDLGSLLTGCPGEFDVEGNNMFSLRELPGLPGWSIYLGLMGREEESISFHSQDGSRFRLAVELVRESQYRVRTRLIAWEKRTGCYSNLCARYRILGKPIYLTHPLGCRLDWAVVLNEFELRVNSVMASLDCSTVQDCLDSSLPRRIVLDIGALFVKSLCERSNLCGIRSIRLDVLESDKVMLGDVLRMITRPFGR